MGDYHVTVKKDFKAREDPRNGEQPKHEESTRGQPEDK